MFLKETIGPNGFADNPAASTFLGADEDEEFPPLKRRRFQSKCLVSPVL
jgi:hypothetical protein